MASSSGASGGRRSKDVHVKCGGEQILFLDSSVYIHIKAFKSPKFVKLLFGNQVSLCGSCCPSSFMRNGRAKKSRHPLQGPGEEKTGRECRLNAILKTIFSNQCVFLPCS